MSLSYLFLHIIISNTKIRQDTPHNNRNNNNNNHNSTVGLISKQKKKRQSASYYKNSIRNPGFSRRSTDSTTFDSSVTKLGTSAASVFISCAASRCLAMFSDAQRCEQNSVRHPELTHCLHTNTSRANASSMMTSSSLLVLRFWTQLSPPSHLCASSTCLPYKIRELAKL